MVGVGLEVVVIVVLLILSIGLQIQARISAKDYLEDYDMALDEMKHSLNVVAQVLQKLPDLVPQFSLVNENPLSQILQFFQQRAEQNSQSDTSLDAERLREPNGTFRDGEKETKES
jgi:hypothetical protein